MVSPSDMLLFAAVVRDGGFTRAAGVLGLTKQTVSERVAKLEAELGVRLLERTTRRLRPTEAGARYYERCTSIAAQIDEANLDAQNQVAEPVGALRISAPVLYGRKFLVPVVAGFLLRYPKVRIEIILVDRLVNLVAEGIDLAIRVGGTEDSSLVARKLGEAHVYYVASPAFLRAHGTPSPQTLRSSRCIGVSAHESWSTGGFTAKIAPVLVVNDLEIACDAAIAGVGIARVPALLCGGAVKTGRLRVLFGAEPAYVRPVFALYPSRQYLPPKVRLFIEALAQLVAPMKPLGRKRTRHRSP